MIDAQKLLDQFLGTGRGAQGHGGFPSGGTGRASTGETLQDGLGKLLGGALGGTGARSGGGIADLAASVLGGRGGGSGGGFAGKAIGGALAGGLVSQLLRRGGGKSMKGLGGSALKLGGLALVAGLGYKAYTNWQAQNQASLAPAQPGPIRPIASAEIPEVSDPRFHPSGSEAEERARLLLSAMIAAAKADGTIDAEEERRIFGRLDDLDLDADEKRLLMTEIHEPMTIDELVRRAPSQEAAVEVYTASLLAIDPDQPAERAYLDLLAARLNLPAELVAEIRRTADEAVA
ncbi:tellurite resistance TerB family protein [Aureimonas ureilytica]|uniref:tellurite resistance TerB family protein n=1 Tax=Aureimonas ureilytica TaxID=401562 RepID=UPI0003744D24|nr:tellurite resistance TerB family protein [Aureimonas ureilytica]